MSLPFECDVCHFRNINKRDVDWNNEQDVRTLMYIRGATLDAMWSRTKGTVEGNMKRLRRDMRDANDQLSLGQFFPLMGNGELEDKVGMRVALVTLQASLRPGRNASTIQWDTMRKTPTWFTHAHESITGQDHDSLYAADNKKMYGTKCVTRSRWFSAFLLGAKRRMGVVRVQDEAITTRQVVGVLEIAEEEWNDEELGTDRKKRLEEVAAFICIGFCASLRGEEVPLTDIAGLITFWEDTLKAEMSHVMVALRGRFKGEDNLKWHMIPIADEKRSNIPSRWWISRLLKTRVNEEECSVGPLFADDTGKKASLRRYDGDFRDLLSKLRLRSPHLFAEGVNIEDYSLRRSLRRGSTTEAQNNKVPSTTIDLINRWRRREKAKGAEPGLSMCQVYTETASALTTILAYSQSF